MLSKIGYGAGVWELSTSAPISILPQEYVRLLEVGGEHWKNIPGARRPCRQVPAHPPGTPFVYTLPFSFSEGPNNFSVASEIAK